jgi:hypothetical protein
MKVSSTFIGKLRSTVNNALLFSSILFFVLSASSCKKDTPDSVPIGTIEAEVDGTKTTFNNEATAVLTTNNRNIMLELKGYKKPRTTSGTYLSLQVLGTSTITTGTYTEGGPGPFTVHAERFVDLFFGVGGSSVTYGSTSDPLSITITDITTTYVKGTFSGELRTGTSGGTNNTYIKLKKGIFHLSL